MALHPIDSNQSSPAQNTPATRPTDKQPPVPANELTSEAPINATDRVSLSSEQLDYHTIQEAIKKVPDIRQEKIEKIKQALASGDYQVPSESIADRLIQDTIINNPID